MDQRLSSNNRTLKIVWFIVFLTLFLLSLDYWNWQNDSLSYWGLPIWVYYFFWLQVALTVALMLFAGTYWGKVDGDDDE